jgi:hypothetical protein
MPSKLTAVSRHATYTTPAAGQPKAPCAGALTLQAVAGLGLLAHDVQDGVDQLGTLGVVTLGPVVARAGLAEDKVVRAEDLAIGTRANAVHGAGLQIHEDGAGNVAACDRSNEIHDRGVVGVHGGAEGCGGDTVAAFAQTGRGARWPRKAACRPGSCKWYMLKCLWQQGKACGPRGHGQHGRGQVDCCCCLLPRPGRVPKGFLLPRMTPKPQL